MLQRLWMMNKEITLLQKEKKNFNFGEISILLLGIKVIIYSNHATLYYLNKERGKTKINKIDTSLEWILLGDQRQKKKRIENHVANYLSCLVHVEDELHL